MPVIRHMCKKLSAPAASPHIFAGVSSILSSTNRPADINIPALITTVCILTLNAFAEDETGPAEYLQRREAASAAVQKALTQYDVEVECGQTDIDDCMRQVNQYGWTDMDWFENVERSLHHNNEDERGKELGGADDGDDMDGHNLPIRSQDPFSMKGDDEAYLQAGLGTMMDDRVDYLSDAKRRSYERWRTETLLQIDELQTQSREMDVDDG